jgi:hypothetical protein
MSKRKSSLDQISLDLMLAGTNSAGIRRTSKNVQACARLQIAIREALRAALPPNDPRRHPDYPFNAPAPAPAPTGDVPGEAQTQEGGR